MRQLLNDLDGAARAWSRFFFAPADPRPLGLIRLAVGGLVTWSFAVLALDLRGFLGADGWADPAVARRMLPPGGWSLWLGVPDALLWPAWALGLVVLILFTAGFAGRITAPLAWVVLVSTIRRAPVILFGFDAIVATWVLYLAVSGASGGAYSVDRWLARRRGKAAPEPVPTVGANLGLRLIQLHLCFIYLIAGLAKLQSPTWWDGSAIGKLLGNSDFRPFDLTWIAAYPLTEYLLNLATHAALAVEIGYAALVWVRGLRPWVVAAALSMHLGIALTLGLTEFSLAMAVANLAFFRAEWLRGVERLAAGRGRAPATAVESGRGEAVAAVGPTAARDRPGIRRPPR